MGFVKAKLDQVRLFALFASCECNNPPTNTQTIYTVVEENAMSAWRNFVFDQPAQIPPDVNLGIPQDTVETIHAFGNQMTCNFNQ